MSTMRMRILMFGWEFPPRMSGGLGTACLGMTSALAGLGHTITFVLPQPGVASAAPFLNLLSAADFSVPNAGRDGGEPEPPSCPALRPVPSLLHAYLNVESYQTLYRSEGRQFPERIGVYGHDLLAEVVRYGQAAEAIVRNSPCDIIHAHDWMTIPAAINARRVSGKPFILHIHSLEYDRSGEHGNGEISAIERRGLHAADRIIAVSHRTKRMIEELYDVCPGKITVVHNAVTRREGMEIYHAEQRGTPREQKTVLYLGRITFQKGPDYFIEAAARVLEILPEVTFVMAGAGDMMGQMIELVGKMGIESHFHFTGFLQGEEIERIFSLSDLYIMPSVSEPFGISPLEAMMYDVPVIISRQSGVSEILTHALKVDFWDVRDLAGKIIAVLKYPVLAVEMAQKAHEELRGIRWEKAAEKIVEVYRAATASGSAQEEE